MDLLEKQPLKRKSDAGTRSRKKKRVERTAEQLPWKRSQRPLETGLGGDDGILELEEVEGVEVVYEMTEGGRVAKFRVTESDKPEGSSRSSSEARAHKKVAEDDIQELPAPGPLTFDREDPPTRSYLLFILSLASLLPGWAEHSLHPQLMHILHEKGFENPTPIQAAVISVVSKNRDVIGVAQTGSGKTLAYGLPILHYLLSQPRSPPNQRRPVRALILAPTRELALQVSSHLNTCLNPVERQAEPSQGEGKANTGKTGKGKTKGKGTEKEADTPAPPTKKPPPHVSVAAIVGGMSSQKQRRILNRGVDVLVATPGRLWDIMEDDDNLAKEIKELRFLVLDEADRMIETGHFAELENILRLTLRENQDDEIPTEYDAMAVDEDVDEQKPKISDGLRTFVLSATLSKDLQRNLRKRIRHKPSNKRKNNDERLVSTLAIDDLLLRLDFRDPEPEIIDLSPEGKVVSTLQEAKIECLTNDKDVYLYYFLLRHPGRSLVFLSSIDGIRRLMPLLELLSVKVFPLHSQLEQRQRLKNLDRFKSTPNAVLLATDIAARGLDIPTVDHVIHFQIPRTADTYIHRSGRTARALNKGFSMLMVGPDERRVVKALMSSMSRDETELPELTVELNLLDKLKARVQLARQIDQSQHKVKKANYEKSWMKETAEALGVDLDSDYMSDSDSEKQSNRERKATEAKAHVLKDQLKVLLAQPLVARGVSTKYITSGSRPIINDIMAGDSHETLLGLKKAEAGSELVLKKSNQQRK
ncbi:ATP-dependent RNA helicase MAK5 [Leucoagaricus sp. SymC.cos]|nr:ATP-dependent RNA helicase MAK5 [Leucoagaricus sp. SymC.cos]